MIDLTSYKVQSLTFPYGKYQLGSPADIIDEGSFYRINGTHILDKFKILSTDLVENELTIHMKDRDVILTVVSI